PNRARSIETDRCLAVVTAQRDFAGADAALVACTPAEDRRRAAVKIQALYIRGKQLFLAVESEHLHKSGICVQQLALGRGEVNAFLQGFEKLGQTGLFLALTGNVAGERAGPYNDVVLH